MRIITEKRVKQLPKKLFGSALSNHVRVYGTDISSLRNLLIVVLSDFIRLCLMKH